METYAMSAFSKVLRGHWCWRSHCPAKASRLVATGKIGIFSRRPPPKNTPRQRFTQWKSNGLKCSLKFEFPRFIPGVLGSSALSITYIFVTYPFIELGRLTNVLITYELSSQSVQGRNEETSGGGLLEKIPRLASNAAFLKLESEHLCSALLLECPASQPRALQRRQTSSIDQSLVSSPSSQLVDPIVHCFRHQAWICDQKYFSNSRGQYRSLDSQESVSGV